ncbi:MAG: hypothetical protein LBB15_00485, partial [Puniceicoccales bacterium]|nr:hypothetical protein [Puniceicoccales bacterium]
MNKFEYDRGKNTGNAAHENLGNADFGDASAFQGDIGSELSKSSEKHDELGEKFRELLTTAKREKTEQVEANGEKPNYSWHLSPIQHAYDSQYDVTAKEFQLEQNGADGESVTRDTTQISPENQAEAASDIRGTTSVLTTQMSWPGKKTTDENGQNLPAFSENSSGIPLEYAQLSYESLNQWTDDNLNFTVPSIFGKNLQDIRPFAMLLFPEELTDTKLEGWNTSAALGLFRQFIDGFKNLGTQVSLDREVLGECYDALGDVSKNMSIQEDFNNREYLTQYTVASDVFSFLNYKSEINRERMEKHNLSQDVLSALRDIYLKSYSHSFEGYERANREMAIELCARFSSQPKDILSRLKKDGDYVHLGSGWTANSGGHCAYIILEKRGEKIYAHEMNAGGGTFPGERIKGSMYGTRITPGRTIEFSTEKDILSFISDNFELQRPSEWKSSETREKEYIDMWNFGKAVPNPSSFGRPRFTEYLQRSGNCTIKSTDLLVRTVLQRTMARKLGLDINNPKVVQMSNKLYRLYAIYSRVQFIENSLNWHKDPANASQIDRDSLDMLRRGAGRLGHYLERYANGLTKKMTLSKEEKILIEYATRLNEEVEKYLALPATKEIVARAQPHTRISTAISPELNENAKAKAKSHTEAVTFIEQSSQQKQHIILDSKKIKNDPTLALSYAKFVATENEDLDLIIKFCSELSFSQGCVILNEPHHVGNTLALLKNENMRNFFIKTILALSNFGDGYISFFVGVKNGYAWRSLFYKSGNFFCHELNCDISESLLNEARQMANDCKKFISDDRINVSKFFLALVNSSNGDVSRYKEIIEQGMELLREIPLPNEPGWNEYMCKLDPSQRREFVGYIGKIVNMLSGIPAVKKLLIKKASALNEHLLDDENVLFPHYEMTPIMNALTKARIVAFECAKNDPFLGKYINNQNGHLDHKLFETFCKSAVNFPMDKGDRDEQVRLWEYVTKTRFGPNLFDYTIEKDFAAAEFDDPTLKVYDNLLIDLNSNSDDRRMKVGSIESLDGNGSDDFANLITLHPGLCAYGRLQIGDGWKVLQQLFTNQKSEDFNAFNDFRQIMTYGVECQIYNSSLKRCKVNDDTVKSFPDFFGKIGGGYALKSENLAIKLTEESKSLPLIERLIGEELARPDAQSFGLLRLLGDHLGLCNEFYADHSSDPQAKPHMNLWLQAFNRVLYPNQYPDADCRINQAQSPLYNEARAHPLELLDEIQTLWDKGKKEFWDNIPDKRPKIKQLGALIHVAHLVCKNVIEADERNQNCGPIQQKLQGILDDVVAARNSCGDTLTPDEQTLLRLAENECISSFIAIAQKTNVAVNNDLLLTFYENAFRLQNFDSKGLPKGCSEVIYKSVPALAKYWQNHEYQAKHIAVNLYDRLAFSAHRLTKIECNRFFSAVESGIGQFGDGYGNFVDLVNLRIFDSGNELKNVSRAFENEDYIRLFPMSGISSAREIIAAGKQYKFTDPGRYGNVTMLESAGTFKIYRKFADSQMSWCHVAPEQACDVNLPDCFGGDDFCIWTSENENFRICAKNNPNEILYETDNRGRL